MRNPEPLLWLLFSAGGVAAALVFPAVLLLFGLAIPLGWVAPPDAPRLGSVLASPFARPVTLAFCALSLFHAAHRLRYTICDGLRMKHLDRVLATLCYGGAVAGATAAAYVLLLSAV